MTLEEMQRIAEAPAWPHDQTWANVEALAKYSETFGPPCIKRLLRVCAAAYELGKYDDFSEPYVADEVQTYTDPSAVNEVRAELHASLAALDEEGV